MRPQPQQVVPSSDEMRRAAETGYAWDYKKSDWVYAGQRVKPQAVVPTQQELESAAKTGLIY